MTWDAEKEAEALGRATCPHSGCWQNECQPCLAAALQRARDGALREAAGNARDYARGLRDGAPLYASDRAALHRYAAVVLDDFAAMQEARAPETGGPPPEPRGAFCALCGQKALGFATVPEGRLCHDESRDCYRRWTVYGERPAAPQPPELCGSGVCSLKLGHPGAHLFTEPRKPSAPAAPQPRVEEPAAPCSECQASVSDPDEKHHERCYRRADYRPRVEEPELECVCGHDGMTNHADGKGWCGSYAWDGKPCSCLGFRPAPSKGSARDTALGEP